MVPGDVATSWPTEPTVASDIRSEESSDRSSSFCLSDLLKSLDSGFLIFSFALGLEESSFERVLSIETVTDSSLKTKPSLIVSLDVPVVVECVLRIFFSGLACLFAFFSLLCDLKADFVETPLR